MSTSPYLRRAALLAAVAVAQAISPVSSRATLPGDLCTGHPCLVAGAITVDPGSVLEFGPGVELRLTGQATLTVGPGTASREVVLRDRLAMRRDPSSPRQTWPWLRRSALGLPRGPGEACPRAVTIDLPTGPRRLMLRVATGFGDSRQTDSDALVLRCRR